MVKAISILLTLVAAVTLNAQTVKPIYVVHVSLGNNDLPKTVIEELLRPNPNFQNRPVVLLRPDLDTINNAFAVSKWGRQTGLTRPGNEIKYEETPILTPKMVQWFEDLEKKDIHPEVFLINGHHLVGMGFESDNTWETKYKSQFGNSIELSKRNLYTHTLIRSRNYFPVVARFFDNIKMVFIGGCEGLANLEPKEFGTHGRALTPEQIKELYFNGQKTLVLGDARAGQGLGGYKEDLVRVYPGSYTDKANDEVCVDSVNHLDCEVYDVNRIMPESGLWDGLHMYNMPLQMKRLFPKAYGIFGFNTPSPLSPGAMWRQTFSESRRKLSLPNIFQPLLSDETPTEEKKQILQTMRVSWTKATQQLNKRTSVGKTINRISGSVTPAFPELDANGIFAYEAGASEFSEAPAFAPYEVRDGATPAPVVEATPALQPVRGPVVVAPKPEKAPAKAPEKAAVKPKIPVKTKDDDDADADAPMSAFLKGMQQKNK